MPSDTPTGLIASVSRALWGEVSGKLRSVEFQADGQHIRLALSFDERPNQQDLDSVGAIGAAVAADFPDCSVAEEALATDPSDPILCRDGWHLAYARKEPSLVR